MTGIKQNNVYTVVGFIILSVVYTQRCHAACPNPKFTKVPNHSACLSKSANAQSSGVSAAEIIEIVDRHNFHRSNVAPTATDMLKMSWDDEIASVAQALADNCNVNTHDANYERIIPGRYTAGQNLGSSSGSHSWTARIDDWHSEHANFQFDTGSTNGQDVGHYTQVVWAKSFKIGCGYTYCTNGGHYYVCNYSPPGNLMPNQYRPYTTGTNCAACPNSQNGKLCDCSSQQCYNGGTLDIDTCVCACKSGAHYVQPSCALNCSAIGGFSCGWTDPAKCSQYDNIPSDCPVLCNFCPEGDSTGSNVDDISTTTAGSGTAAMTTARNTIFNQPILICLVFMALLYNVYYPK